MKTITLPVRVIEDLIKAGTAMEEHYYGLQESKDWDMVVDVAEAWIEGTMTMAILSPPN